MGKQSSAQSSTQDNSTKQRQQVKVSSLRQGSSTNGNSPRNVNTALQQTTIKQHGRRQEWISKYECELGMRPVRAGSEQKVVEAWCRFCEIFGREDVDETTGSLIDHLLQTDSRQKTKRIKVFKSFRSDNIVKHLKEQHPAHWEAYSALAADDLDRRRNFFLHDESR